MYDGKFVFSTQYRPRTRFISNVGQRERILYQPKFDENGVMDLVESGKEDLYDFIQSHAEAVDIHVILARFQNGDIDALSRVQGAYGDFTNMPTTYADLLNRVNEGQSFFNSLPVDIRAKFNHILHHCFLTAILQIQILLLYKDFAVPFHLEVYLWADENHFCVEYDHYCFQKTYN